MARPQSGASRLSPRLSSLVVCRFRRHTAVVDDLDNLSNGLGSPAHAPEECEGGAHRAYCSFHQSEVQSPRQGPGRTTLFNLS